MKVEGTSAMNRAEIISELEAMVSTRLFSCRPWLSDRETFSAVNRKLIQMGLVERVSVEPDTWRYTPLGKELDVELFEVFVGLIAEWDAAMILAEHGFIDESEFDFICMRLAAKADGDLVLKGYVIRAYFAYRKATKFLH